MKKVAVVGMPQSGSTAIFNIVLRLLKSSGVDVKTSVVHPFINKDPSSVFCSSRVMTPERIVSFQDSSSLLLLKEHHFVKELFDNCEKIICVRRNIMDAIVSRKARGKELESKGQRLSGIDWPRKKDEKFKRYCEYLARDCYQAWQSKKTLNVSYEEYCKTPEDIVKKIATFLGSGETIEARDILEKALEYRDEEDWFTLFTSSKVGNQKQGLDLSEFEKEYIFSNFEEMFYQKNEHSPPKVNRILTGFSRASIGTEKIQDWLGELYFSCFFREVSLERKNLNIKTAAEISVDNAKRQAFFRDLDLTCFFEDGEPLFEKYPLDNETKYFLGKSLESINLYDLIRYISYPKKQNKKVDLFSFGYEFSNELVFKESGGD